VPQGSHCQSAEFRDLGGLCCFAVPGLAQGTVNKPEGKGGSKGKTVGNTENLALKEKG